jgi:hypothetical protein
MVVNYGWTAVVPQRDIMVNQWYGQGWIVTDPETGAAGYLIAGGLVSGGAMSAAGGNGTEPIETDIADPYASMPIEMASIIPDFLVDIGLKFLESLDPAAILGSFFVTLLARYAVLQYIGLAAVPQLLIITVVVAISSYFILKYMKDIWLGSRLIRRRWYG